MKEKIWLVAMIFAAAAASESSSIYAAAYQVGETLYLSVAATLIFSLALTVPLLLVAATLSNPAPSRFVAAITGLFVAYRIYAGFNPWVNTNVGIKILIVIFAVSLALTLVRFLGSLFWTRLARFSVCILCCWMLSIPIISNVQAIGNSSYETTLDVAHLFEKQPKAVVVIVFDELSPESVGPITEALNTMSALVYETKSRKAGKNTINAIPSMLTDRRHDDVTICGPAQLCGPTPFLMSSLVAKQSSTDVIGFYHPYCTIKGLRYCWRASETNQSDPLRAAFISAASRLPMASRLLPTIQTNHETIYGQSRQQIETQAFSVPFWDYDGGLLYIHQLLPHPVGFGKARKLSDEYRENIERVAVFVSNLHIRLRHQFKDDYAIVITSDHPLRAISVWCKNPIYSSDTCVNENPIEGEFVPFVVVAPNGVAVNLPATNVGVFSPRSTN